MRDVFTPLDCRQTVILNPIYMSREQFEDSAYIPYEVRRRIIIVDVEKDDDTGHANGRTA